MKTHPKKGGVCGRTAIVGKALIASAALAASGHATAFSLAVHAKITKEELATITASSGGITYRWNERLLNRISEDNQEVDSRLNGTAALFRPDLHFTNETYYESTSSIKSLRTDLIAIVRGQGNPIGFRHGVLARRYLGEALHTIQDFYAHSTWVERGHLTTQAALGSQYLPDPPANPAVCPSNPNVVEAGGGSYDSSAYFVGFTFSRETIGCVPALLPAGKCYHGNYRSACPGINKDLDAAGVAEENATGAGIVKSPYHENAVILARQATRNFVQGIVDEIGDDPKALRALFGGSAQLAVMIDKTTSMSDDLAGIKTLVAQMVQSTSSLPEDERPSSYLLQTYGDPDIDAPVRAEDPNQFLSAVNGIALSGGGSDCPELTNSGLLSAVGSADEGSTIYVFTDATSKDQEKLNDVISLAKTKEIRLVYALTGSCSPTDPGYIRSASETGGMVFRVTPAQIPSLFALINPETAGTRSTIVKRSGSAVSGQPFDISIPVDSGLRDLAFSLTVPENNVSASYQVTMKRPSGVAVSSTDPGVIIKQFGSTGYFATIAAPEAGAWTAQVSGYGPYASEARGTSVVVFDRFNFVEPNEDIHGGFFPIPGEPVAGTTALASAKVVGSVGSAVFSLVDEGGQQIAPLTLIKNAPTADREAYLGSVTLPTTPFRIAVVGTLTGGSPFARVYPDVYRAQSVAVGINGNARVETHPETTEDVVFHINNLGSAGTFSVSAVSSAGYSVSVAPESVTLANGESGEVTASVQIPSLAASFPTSFLALTATRTGTPAVFNSATTTIVVAPAIQYQALATGVPVGNQSGLAGQETVYKFELPVNAATLSFITYGGTGNVSLYAAKGRVPTASDNDGFSIRASNSETIRFYNQTPNVWFVKLVGVASYSGVTIVARTLN